MNEGGSKKIYTIAIYTIVISFILLGITHVIISDMKMNAELLKKAQHNAQEVNGRNFVVKRLKNGPVPEKAYSSYEITFEDAETKKRFSWNISSYDQCSYNEMVNMQLVVNDRVLFTASENPVNACGETIFMKTYLNITRIID